MTAIEVATFFSIPEGAQQPKIDLVDEAYQRFQAERYPGATKPEYLVFWWLEQRGFREFEDFFFQISLLGGRNGGGFVIDFLILRDVPDNQLVLEVQGVAFHANFVFGDPAEQKAYDKLKRAAVEGAGYRVVWVSDLKLDTALDETMRVAMTGRDVL